MITLTLEEYLSAMMSQNAPMGDVTFQCPRCRTLQSANDLIKAGAGKNINQVKRYLGFSCIGRFDSSKGCSWSLGGLFQIHELEIVFPNGEPAPRFIPISADLCL